MWWKNLKKEFASMLVVGRSNSIILPPCHTVQENSICTLVEYPSFLSDSTHNKLERIMQKLSLHIKGRGIYAFEFFEDDKGDVYINEAAPRVHNSYHFTIEAFEKNQFEYFIDAVLGNDLYPVTEVHPFVSMVNLLGHTEGEDYQLKYPNIEGEFKTKIHMYGKKECRKGRKMGHLTLYGKTHNFDYAKKINREYTL